LKNYKIIIVFVLTLAAGVIIGNRFSSKMNERADVLKTIQQPLPQKGKERVVPGQNGVTKAYTVINLIVQEDDIDPVQDVDRLALEDILKTKSFEIHISSTDKNFKNAIQDTHPSRKNSIMGVLSPTRFASMTARSPQLVPLYFTSLEPQVDCYNETQVVRNAKSSILTPNDFNNKKIGIEDRVLIQSKLMLQKLKEKGVSPSKIIIYSQRSKGLNDLLHSNIDVFYTRAKVFSSGAVESGVGTVTENGFLETPGIKIVTTSDFKIPCRIMFINSRIDSRIIEDVKNKLMDVSMKPELQSLLRKGLLISTLREVVPEQWKKIQTEIIKGQNISLNSLTHEFYQNDPNPNEILQTEVAKHGPIPFEKQ